MLRTLGHRLALFAAIVVVSMASVVSAARMAPDAGEASFLAGQAVASDAGAGYCGEAPSHRHHRCEFCRLLSAPPAIAFAPPADRLSRDLAQPVAASLTRGPQGGNPHVAARAPPLPA